MVTVSANEAKGTDRLARMEVDYKRRKEISEYNQRRDERLKVAEERTLKKRLTRQEKNNREETEKEQTE